MILNIEEMNQWIQKLVEYVGGEKWFEIQKGHPLSNLWFRRDYTATNELINFAHSVYEMEKLDSHWLRQAMLRVRKNNVNNAKGAIFEIQGLSYLLGADYKVSPASDGYPGIDGVLINDKGNKINISMKNYGISNAETMFQKQMESVKNEFVRVINKTNYLTLQCLIKFKVYPSENDIVKLKEALLQYVMEFGSVLHKDVIIGNAEVSLNLMSGYQFAKGFHSYSFIAFSPLHTNEVKNLQNKLEDACANLMKQKKVESKNELNGIFIHLHETAAIDVFQKELQDILADNPNWPISFVWLYLPCLASDKQGGKAICNIVKPVINPSRIIKKNMKDMPLPIFNFFLGYCCENKPKRILFANQQEIEHMDDCYVYQKSDMYYMAPVSSNGYMEVQIGNPAPGVREIPIVKFNNKLKAFEGSFPEDDYLEIY